MIRLIKTQRKSYLFVCAIHPTCFSGGEGAMILSFFYPLFYSVESWITYLIIF